MNRNKSILLASSALVAGAFVAGGVNLASAASGDSSPSATPQPGAPHDHTPVTGSARTEVVAAVTAKYAGIEVVDVRKDPDGSYDVMGTRDGAPVLVEVSKDLKTIELRTGGPHGPGGPGRGFGGHGPDTAVTGSEKTTVVDAVEAKYDDVQVADVRKDPDGSYDAMGTQDGYPVFVEVSKDLKTIELRTGGPGGFGGPRPDGADDPGTSATPSSTT